MTADLRVYMSQVDTQALYFNIIEDVNDTSLPVRVDNRGVNERDLAGASLKLDFDLGGGTLTSITAYDEIEELLTGDQFDFLPYDESVLKRFFFSDQAQHQWLDVEAVSQEIRYTSPAEDRLRWILGAYVIATDRFISTGNVFDDESGVVPEVKETPLPPFAPQFTFLADSQDNLAWAVFGELSYDISDRLEGSVALRYDRDERENTTDTPQNFIPGPINCVQPPTDDPDTGSLRVHGPGARGDLGRPAAQGDPALQAERRPDDLPELQPRLPQRGVQPDRCRLGRHRRHRRPVRPGDGGHLRGRRQGAVRGQPREHERQLSSTPRPRARTSSSSTRTRARRISATSTRSSTWGSRPSCRPRSPTGSRCTCAAATPTARSRRSTARTARGCLRTWATRRRSSPSTRSTWVRSGGYRSAAPTGTSSSVRTYQIIGPTWFYPDNFTERDTVDLLNLRAGIETDSWSLVAWSRNLTDEEYNAEWSPGPMFFPSPGYTNNFVFKAQPQVWGIDLTYRF